MDVIPNAQPKPRSLWHTLHLTPARAIIMALILVSAASMFAARRGALRNGQSKPAMAAPTTPSSAVPCGDRSRRPPCD